MIRKVSSIGLTKRQNTKSAYAKKYFYNFSYLKRIDHDKNKSIRKSFEDFKKNMDKFMEKFVYIVNR